MASYISAIYEQKNGVPTIVNGTQKSTDAEDIALGQIRELEQMLQSGQFIGTGSAELAEKCNVRHMGSLAPRRNSTILG